MPHQYFFVAVDPAKDVMSATVYYALKADGAAVEQTYAIEFLDGWKKVKIDGAEWTQDEMWSNYYYNRIEGERPIKQTIVNIDRNISEAHIREVIAERIPNEE